MSEKTSAFSYLSNEYDFHKIIGDSAYEYRTGVEFTPQELYMLVGKGDSTKEGYYRFDNKKFGRSKHRIEYKPSKGWELPTEYIYPIVTGPSLTPFHSKRKNEFCILPYTVDKTDEPINISEMRRTNLDLFRYLLDHQHLIEQQSEKSKMMHRGKEFYALSKIGPYTFAEYIVAARDNTRFCAAVIEPTRTPWNETKSSICVKHTIIIGRTNNGRFITKDEAHYIAGILNSDIVIQYIQNTFKSNGYSLKKSHFYIPEYDKSDPRHIKISIIAQKAAKLDDDSRIKKIQRELSNLYLEVCDTK